MTDTLSLLFDLQKKMDHIKVQIENIKKLTTNGENNSDLSSVVNEIKNNISNLATNDQLEERYNDLVEYILNGSSLVECDEIIELVNELKSKIESDHQGFTLSFEKLEQIKEAINSINETIGIINNNYEVIFTTLSGIDVRTDTTLIKLGIQNDFIKSEFSAMANTLTTIYDSTNKIGELLTDIESVYGISTGILAKVNTVIDNQTEMLSLLQNSSSGNGGNTDSNESTGETGDSSQNTISECCEQVNSKLDVLDDKVNLILTAMNLEYEGDNGSGDSGDGGGGEYVEPDTSLELTNCTKINDLNYYQGAPSATTNNEYFRCNPNNMMVICCTPILGCSETSDLRLDLYINDNLEQSYNYLAFSGGAVTISHATQSTQELNTIKLVLNNTSSSNNVFIDTVLFTIYAKNAQAISGDDTYEIFANADNYTISKTTSDYMGYATYDPTTEFDETTLAYTSKPKKIGRRLYTLEGVNIDDYNKRSAGDIIYLYSFKQNKSYEQYDENFYLTASRYNNMITDLSCCTFKSNYILYAGVNDNVVSVKGYSANNLQALNTLPTTAANIPFGTTETPYKANFVRMGTSPNLNAYNPSIILTTTSGNNYFNHNFESNSYSIIDLGYGTNVKACYLNDALNIGVFMKVYDKFILKRLCPHRLKQFSTDFNVKYVNRYTLDEQVFELGSYDEIHPGKGGEYFAVKDGKLQKLLLPLEALKDVSYIIES